MKAVLLKLLAVGVVSAWSSQALASLTFTNNTQNPATDIHFVLSKPAVLINGATGLPLPGHPVPGNAPETEYDLGLTTPLNTGGTFTLTQPNGTGPFAAIGTYAPGPQAPADIISFCFSFAPNGTCSGDPNLQTVTVNPGYGAPGVPTGTPLTPTDLSSWHILLLAVPEMSTWMLMIVGFGFVGGTLRRRSVSTMREPALTG